MLAIKKVVERIMMKVNNVTHPCLLKMHKNTGTHYSDKIIIRKVN